MGFDPARLYSLLLRTGLQNKDNALYQLLHDLIKNLSTLNTSTNTIISSGSGGLTVGPRGLTGAVIFGEDGIDGTDGIGIPGAAGAAGIQGTSGVSGYTIFGEDGIDGIDGNPGIPGTAGTAGTPGIQGYTIFGEDGTDGMDGVFGIQGATGQQGIQGLSGVNVLVLDGVDGEDGIIRTGIQGIQGLPAPIIFGSDGDDGADGIPGSPSPSSAIDNTYTVVAPVTGATVVMAIGQQRIIINPAGTLALLTVTLPAGPSNGQIAGMSFTQVITGLTVNAGTNTVTAPPTTAAVDSTFRFIYQTSSLKWFPTA
jgi:hypothetical protein